MKKKFLALLCAVICLPALLFVGCDLNEVKEVTKTGIETTAEIVPFEYSVAAASSVFYGASINSLKQKYITLNETLEEYINGIPTSLSIGVGIAIRDSEGYLNEYYKNENLNSDYIYEYLFLRDENLYKQYNIDANKKYEVIDTNNIMSYSYVLAYLDAGAFVNLIASGQGFEVVEKFSITSGRYFKGYDIITAEDTTRSEMRIGDGPEDVVYSYRKTYYEFVIKDGLIVNETIDLSISDGNYKVQSSVAHYEFSYEEVSLPNIDLSGYTLAE